MKSDSKTTRDVLAVIASIKHSYPDINILEAIIEAIYIDKSTKDEDLLTHLRAWYKTKKKTSPPLI